MSVVLIWCGGKLAGEENVTRKHKSSGVLSRGGNTTLAAQFMSAVLPRRVLKLAAVPRVRDEKGNCSHSLTSLVKQQAQRGALPASESSLSSGWISGWTPNRWQTWTALFHAQAGTLPWQQKKRSLMRMTPYTVLTILTSGYKCYFSWEKKKKMGCQRDESTCCQWNCSRIFFFLNLF